MWLCVQRLLAWAAPGRVVPPSPTTSSSPRRMRNHLPGMLRRIITFLAGSPGKTAPPWASEEVCRNTSPLYRYTY